MNNKPRLKGIGIYITIILTFFVFSPIINNQFLSLWDDQWQVINRWTERGFSSSNIKSILTTFYYGQYSPINQLIYTMLFDQFGYTPSYFHLTSLIFHICNITLLYGILNRILPHLCHCGLTEVRCISLITTSIFAIHPIQVESVAWLSASKIVICVFFYLISSYLYIIFLERRKLSYYILSLVGFILSTLTKEQAVILPVWFLLIHWTYNIPFKSKETLRLIPFFMISIIMGLVTIFAQMSNGMGFLNAKGSYTLYQRGLLACFSIIEYITKWICPFRLSYIYPFPFEINEQPPWWLNLYPIGIGVLIYKLWHYIAKSRVIIFGLLFFIIHILLVLHIIPMSRFTVTADRYIYLPIIGLSLILIYLIVTYYSKLQEKWTHPILIGSGAIVLLGMMTYTYQQCKIWHDTDTLKNEIRTNLRKRSHSNNIVKNSTNKQPHHE